MILNGVSDFPFKPVYARVSSLMKKNVDVLLKLEGLRRASGLIVLNSVHTGFATAIMEGGAISAARTGAFAGIACRALLQNCARPKLAIIGCGPIALTTLSYLKLLTDPGELRVFDLVEGRAETFAANSGFPADRVRKVDSLAEALAGTDVALFATTASQPYLKDLALLADCKVVLHVSLRDISEDVLAQCFNVSDDRDHVLREETSLHRLSRLQADRSPIDADSVVFFGAALLCLLISVSSFPRLALAS